jgi:hypothetical protein
MDLPLTRLTVEQMHRVSSAWLEEDNKNRLLKIRQVAGLVPDLEAQHKTLAVYTKQPEDHPALAKNRAEAKARDSRHDRLVRGGIHLLLARAALAETPEEETEAQELLALVYPEGFDATAKTYEEEAGAAGLRRERLSDEVRARLKAITFRGTDALAAVEGAIAEAELLGRSEVEKRQLERELKEQSQSASAAAVKRAQYDWIETARLVVQGLSQAVKRGTAVATEAEALLEPLTAALVVAEERARRRKKRDDAKEPAEESGTGD